MTTELSIPRSGSPPDKHRGDRQRGEAGRSGFAAETLATSYSSPASTVFMTSCACATCCAV
jgi:hypothetical protein